MQKDPVCGMSVDPGKAAGNSSYQGKTYYFCSLDCKKNFDKNPAQYTTRLFDDFDERILKQIFRDVGDEIRFDRKPRKRSRTGRAPLGYSQPPLKPARRRPLAM